MDREEAGEIEVTEAAGQRGGWMAVTLAQLIVAVAAAVGSTQLAPVPARLAGEPPRGPCVPLFLLDGMYLVPAAAMFALVLLAAYRSGRHAGEQAAEGRLSRLMAVTDDAALRTSGVAAGLAAEAERTSTSATRWRHLAALIALLVVALAAAILWPAWGQGLPRFS